jgi:hypothetical protein
MNKSLKRTMTALLTMVMVLSSMVAISVPAKAQEEGTAYISYASEDWAVQYWFDGKDYAPIVSNTQAVSGYGQYTVSLDLTGVEGGMGKGIAFLDVEIANGETLFPNSFMKIDELKINGDVVNLGKTYTSSDDAIATRTNLYNEWVAEVEKGRTIDGDIADLTAAPINKADFPEVKTIEITFTLGEGIPFGASAPVGIPLPAEGTTAYIAMADNSWTYQYWFDGKDYAPVVAKNATVTGFGQYTASLDFSGVAVGSLPDIVFMDVEIKDGELYFPNAYMQIDEIKIDGTAIEFGPTYTNSDNGTDTRTNLFNTWVAEVTEGRTNGLDLSEVSAVPVDGKAFTNIKTVEVTFTLIEGEPLEEAEEAYVMPSDFNAFMMFSDVSGAWESYAPGVSGDTKVIGDGKYSVYIKGADIGATGQATLGQVFLVDIEELGRAMVELGTLREAEDGSFTDTDVEVTVEVFIDGNPVTVKNKNIRVGDLEGNGRLRLELYNVWGSGTADLPVVMPELLIPANEIRVDFTLVGTGLNTGAVIEEAAEPVAEVVEVAEPEPVVETTEESSDEGTDGSSTGLIIGIIVVVLAAAGGTVYFLKKKK